MSTARASHALLTCPDCGGILEPSRPVWSATIDVAAALDARNPEPAAWRCLICGYYEPIDRPDEAQGGALEGIERGAADSRRPES